MLTCPGCGMSLVREFEGVEVTMAGDHERRFLPGRPSGHVVTALGGFPAVACPQIPGQLLVVIPSTGEVMPLVVAPAAVMPRHPLPTPTRIEIVQEGKWR